MRSNFNGFCLTGTNYFFGECFNIVSLKIWKKISLFFLFECSCMKYVFFVFSKQVQSDHFVEFFAPELDKHGYQALYKRKTNEVDFTFIIYSEFLHIYKKFILILKSICLLHCIYLSISGLQWEHTNN